MRNILFMLFLGLASLVHAQQAITLEDIFLSGDLSARDAGSFQFLNDGQSYTRLESNRIIRFDLASGRQSEVMYHGGPDVRIQSYTLSADEQRILIETGREKIYRYTNRSDFLVYDRETRELYPVSSHGKQMHATFSPDGTQVAFVRENNLYISEYMTGTEIQVTQDGKVNEVINGSPDWVYEEEFKLVRAFEWSPDGTRLAYFRFDETRVPEFTMTLYHDALYPEYVTYKYPKVGEPLSEVTIHVYDLATGQSVQMDLGDSPPVYIPRINFTRDPDQLCVTLLNRAQNHLELRLAHAGTGDSRTLFTEINATYLRIHDHLHFLEDGRHFLWTSEADGWNHLYLYDLDGRLVRQLTRGEWEVTSVYALDEARRTVWFQSAGRTPLEREVRCISLDDGQLVRDLGSGGFQDADFSTTCDYLILETSTIHSPPVFEVRDHEGRFVRLIEDNQALVERQRYFGVQPAQFFVCPGADQALLDGWMIRPPGFDPDRTYPVLMYVYGGPGYQEVTNEWIGQRYWWFQLLANQGIIIAAVDGRGSGGRGEAFRKVTYRQLGHFETLDQIAAARYLAGLPYVDAGRIAIYGGSYGGYLSSLCLLKGPDVFKAAIAVSPVTNWKWYDAVYTERYMGTERDNPGGYRENSPVYFADQLRGDYLLIHGMADDNVHYQHTAEMTRALVDANKPFEMYAYTNKAHSISGGNARIHLYTRMTNFLLRAFGMD